MNKILIHIQGDEITGSIDESVRYAITKLSHLHFASTVKSRNNITRLGENKRNVYFSAVHQLTYCLKIIEKTFSLCQKDRCWIRY